MQQFFLSNQQAVCVVDFDRGVLRFMAVDRSYKQRLRDLVLAAIESRHLNQRQFAKLCGFSDHTIINRWVKMDYLGTPQEKSLKIVCPFLGFSEVGQLIDYLNNGEIRPPIDIEMPRLIAEINKLNYSQTLLILREILRRLEDFR